MSPHRPPSPSAWRPRRSGSSRRRRAGACSGAGGRPSGTTRVSRGFRRAWIRERWSVPLIVDGRRTLLEGELRRFPPPSLWPWLGMLCCFLAAAAAPLLLRRRDLLRSRRDRLRRRRRRRLGGDRARVRARRVRLAGHLDRGPRRDRLPRRRSRRAAPRPEPLARRRRDRTRPASASRSGSARAPVFLHPIVLAILPATITRLLAVSRSAPGSTPRRSAALLRRGARRRRERHASDLDSRRRPLSAARSRLTAARGSSPQSWRGIVPGP